VHICHRKPNDGVAAWEQPPGISIRPRWGEATTWRTISACLLANCLKDTYTPPSMIPLCPSQSPDTVDMEGPWTSGVLRPVARVASPPRRGEEDIPDLAGKGAATSPLSRYTCRSRIMPSWESGQGKPLYSHEIGRLHPVHLFCCTMTAQFNCVHWPSKS